MLGSMASYTYKIDATVHHAHTVSENTFDHTAILITMPEDSLKPWLVLVFSIVFAPFLVLFPPIPIS